MFLTAVKPLNSLQRSRVSITKSSIIPEARPAVLPVRGPKSPPCYIVVCLRNRWHVSTPLSNFPPSMSVFYVAAPPHAIDRAAPGREDEGVEPQVAIPARSEERRGGKEGVRTYRSGRSQYE